MKMAVPKISDNFQRTEGWKMISPHHFHPTNVVSSEDSNEGFLKSVSKIKIVLE
jgi:hypothetical protein